jgi:hypothetical protein
MQSAGTLLYFLWSVRLYHIFPDFLINGMIFGKKVIYIKYLLWFSLQLLSRSFLIPMRNERDITRNVHRSSCKGPVVLVRFEPNLNFLHRFSKNLQISNFIKICPVGAQLFHADGRTDRHGLLGTQAHRQVGMMKLIVIFSQICQSA